MNRRFFPLFSSSLFRGTVVVCVLLLATCGGKQTSVPPSSSAGTGSISFAVEWEPPPASPASAIGKPHSVQPMAPPRVCSDYGIANITMEVLSGGTVLGVISATCDTGNATLLKVPADNNLTLHLAGTVPGVGNVWNGYSAPFNLAAGETKNVGKITMSYTGNDKDPPTILSVSPADNATNVPDNSVIQVDFSKPMAVNTVIDINAFVVFDNAANRVSGMFIPSPPLTGTSTYLFQPISRLASGGRYTVTIDNNLVMDMAGNFLNAKKTWSFTSHVTGAFDPAVQIGANDYANNPAIAMAGNGNGFIVWAQTVGGQGGLYSNHYSSISGKWDLTSVRIDSPINDALTLDTFEIAMDNYGNALTAWAQKNGSASTFEKGIWASRYTESTGSWLRYYMGDVQGINGNPVVAVNDRGDGVVYWSYNYSGKGQIMFSKFSDIWQWRQGGPYTLANAGGDNVSVGSIDVALDKNGNNIGVFFSMDAGGVGKVMAFFNSSLYTLGVNGDSPSIAIDNTGKGIAVWSQFDNVLNRKRIYSSWFDPQNMIWSMGIPLESFNGGNAISPRVTLDGSGNAFVVWKQLGSNSTIFYQRNDYVYAKRYDSLLNNWEEPPIHIDNVVENANGEKAYGPLVSTNTNGTTWVIWLQGYGIDFDKLMTRRYDPISKKWGVQEGALESLGSQAKMKTFDTYGVAVNQKGECFVTWESNNDAIWKIFVGKGY